MARRYASGTSGTSSPRAPRPRSGHRVCLRAPPRQTPTRLCGVRGNGWVSRFAGQRRNWLPDNSVPVRHRWVTCCPSEAAPYDSFLVSAAAAGRVQQCDVYLDDLHIETSLVVATGRLKELAGRFDGGLCTPSVGQVESVADRRYLQVADRRGGHRP